MSISSDFCFEIVPPHHVTNDKEVNDFIKDFSRMHEIIKNKQTKPPD